MIEPVVETRRLRPLPRPVKPFRNETIRSFIGRLAAANRLDSDALRCYIAGDKRKSTPLPVERISILSGQSTSALHHAIPELFTSTEPTLTVVQGRPRPGTLIRAACISCTIRRGARGLVMSHLRQEDIVCRRHHRWIGTSGPTAAHRQPSVANQADIIAANRLHRNMIRRYGRAPVEAAYHEAKRVGRLWRTNREHTETFYRVMGIFHPGHWQIAETDPTVEAAAYPQIIAITKLLASPYWRSLPLGTDASIERFAAETRRTTAPEFSWNTTRSYGHCDPLAELFVEEAAHRRGQRPYSYRAPTFTQS